MILNLSYYLHAAIQAALFAGEKIMSVYSGEFEVEVKEDKTPVTLADKLSNQLIEEHLSQTEIPVLGEEGVQIAFENRKNCKQIWIVDPLDGTKEFVKRNGEFTVNIALVEKNSPVIGVIYSPVFKDLYFAAKGLGAFKLDRHKHIELGYIAEASLETIIKNALRLPLFNLNKFTLVASRSHVSSETYQYIESRRKEFGDVEITNTGSSIKMCWIAEGRAHEYPRSGRTMEWDTAAGQCIIEESGGSLVNWDTKIPLNYNKETVENPWFIAMRSFKK